MAADFASRDASSDQSASGAPRARPPMWWSRVNDEHDEPLPAPDEAPLLRRRGERYLIRATALMHCHGRFQTVRIVDFSLSGLQLDGGFGVGAGDDIIVELLTGDRLAGKIVWSLGSRVGVRFPRPLSAEHPGWAALQHAARRTHSRAVTDLPDPDSMDE